MNGRSYGLTLKLCGMFIVGLIPVLLVGCSGFSRQYRASTEGMAINYVVNNESIAKPNAKVLIVVTDERTDKEVIGEGAKPTVGNKFMGYLVLGVLYAAFPDQPMLRDKQDPVKIFQTAMTERLAKNGVVIGDKNEGKVLVIDILVKKFKLDFNFGNWIGEAGYVARASQDNVIICESTVDERAKAFNLWGYASGEKAINDVFNKAINGLDINSCFLKLQ